MLKNNVSEANLCMPLAPGEQAAGIIRMSKSFMDTTKEVAEMRKIGLGTLGRMSITQKLAKKTSG